MKARLNMSFAVAGTALILLTGCVSSRKYKASQAALSQARADSAQLAQQVTTLNGNVHDLQDRGTGLQRSLDSSSNRYTAQQKSLDYYQGYFKEQQDTLAQVNQDVQTSLTQAGITNGDVSQSGNAIYVRLDENDVFKKNSTMVTPVGQKVLDGLAQVVNSRSNVNVAVASGDSAVGWVQTDNMSANSTMTPEPRHYKTVHASHSATSSTSSNTQGSGSVASNATATGTTKTAEPAHRKVHHHYSSEGSMTMSSGTRYPHNRSWALKQGRMVMVANHFLKTGVPKVNVSLQRPPANGNPQSNVIKIIITPSMKTLAPQNSSAMAGTE